MDRIEGGHGRRGVVDGGDEGGFGYPEDEFFAWASAVAPLAFVLLDLDPAPAFGAFGRLQGDLFAPPGWWNRGQPIFENDFALGGPLVEHADLERLRTELALFVFFIAADLVQSALDAGDDLIGRGVECFGDGEEFHKNKGEVRMEKAESRGAGCGQLMVLRTFWDWQLEVAVGD